MKVGDLVIMPGETLRDSEPQSVGIIVDETDPRTHKTWAGKTKRVGVMWVDGGGVIDYEPSSWLKVLSSCKEEEVMV
tara:strand:+ start:226 stop:456 length:231 start_codon:yes stop_codon:yes gene_type:complete